MHKISVFIVCITLIASAQASQAYEPETHRDISNEAFKRALASSYNLQDALPFDAASPLRGIRHVLQIEKPAEWLGDGAVDEDNIIVGGWCRFCNHFYNPIDGTGLIVVSYVGLVMGLPSPMWGINDTEQGFSFADARSSFYNALTDGDQVQREFDWAKTFYTLGHVIHLIQDMAQPQHTRNDSHGPAILGLGGSSLYEKYTKDKGAHIGLPFDGYYPVYPGSDPSTFNEPVDFWHRDDGKGLADYSNRGFVSEHTNFETNGSFAPDVLQPYNIFPHQGFPWPNGLFARVIPVPIKDLPLPQYGPEPSVSLDGDIDFITTPVYDAYTGDTAYDKRTSAYSIFDYDLRAANQPLGFALYRYNFDDAHALLIPRAVSYSAGLLNYFFRGAFTVNQIDYRANEYVVDNQSAEAMDGTFHLYYDDAQGNRQELGAPQTIAVAASIPGQPDSTSSFNFTFAPDPTVSNYVVVFQGTLGAEENKAVVATHMGVASPPIVDVYGLGGGSASDPQNDLAAYSWSISCSIFWTECFPDIPKLGITFCDVPMSNASGDLSGGYAGIPPPTYDLSDLVCDQCCIGLGVVDSQGNRGSGSYCWRVHAPPCS